MDKQLIDYFISETNKKFDKVEVEYKERFTKLDKKVDQLLKFKWQIIGGSVILSMIITLSVQITIAMISKS